ncbi:uncharacterized protein LOC119307656 [Triticum dicoccoides]|uniref:uncharacterized protein LOC119307656 n=1 Tax=Triticum dicoccoides TaxID=85692 RepID=UPI00189072AD|nr:uncharacterized protein LOC119307656 [Triticum dicoccoides]XP_044387100.1 uncharacterized protein LOC123110607 [Triticum aestivum]
MSPSITLTAVATGIAVATGTAELVRGTADVISYMRDKRCRECSMMVKQREIVKHLEDHLEQNQLLFADEKAELQSKLERMADAESKHTEEKVELKEEIAHLEKTLKEEKEELLHKIELL